MQKRHLLLAAVLLATLGATWWASSVPDEKTGARGSTARSGNNSGGGTSASGNSSARPGTATRGAANADAAAQVVPKLTPDQYTRTALIEQPAPGVALAWGPPPPPPPPPAPVFPKGYKPPPPPPPPPPPLPFKAMGKLEDGAVVTAFLLAGERAYTVKAGDTVDSYRIEEVTPHRVVFTYLPLKARQELSLEGQ